MITSSYNPSKLEIELAQIIKGLKSQIEERLSDNVIDDIIISTEKDNPDLVLKLIDIDGDKHEVVVKFIQRPDQKNQ